MIPLVPISVERQIVVHWAGTGDPPGGSPSMIVSRTPFRVTLGGGGTDLPSFYEKHGGFVLAMAMDKYMYVILNVPNADRLIRLHYTRSETVTHVDQLQHELAREAL